jgi:hypothetical protein
MIKIFRNIRKNLLNEGKTTKYFKYAVGEIILVVIGILIALSINNWNESRKEKNNEIGILSTLLKDLQSAEKFSNTYITSEQQYLDIIETVLQNDSLAVLLEDKEITAEYFNKAFWDFAIQLPVINTYSDLKNAGKIALIKNSNIRDRLSLLEANTTNLERLILDRMNVHQMRIDEICVEDVNFLHLIKYKLPNYNITLGAENDYLDIMSRPKVRNLMGIKSVLTNEALGYRKKLHNEIVTTVQLIHSELNDDIASSYPTKENKEK